MAEFKVDESGGLPEETRAERKAREQQKNSFFQFLKELPVLVATAVVIALVVKWLVVQPFYIPSESMEPTLVPGDQVLVSKFIYRFVEPKPGNIIVFEPPRTTDFDAHGADFIKRIVATEGDTIEVRNGEVSVNGKSLDMDYEITTGDFTSFGPFKVPKEHVFVMGDNRANSQDSRKFGPVPEDNIVGRAFVLHWPLNHFKILD